MVNFPVPGCPGCEKCDGVGRVVVAHPDTDVSSLPQSMAELVVIRSMHAPKGMVYEMVCPNGIIWLEQT